LHDLNTIVSGVQPLLRRLIDESIAIDLVCARQALPITADLGQIEQVIVNLAVNARDAMMLGGRLTVSTAIVELDADYAAAHFNVKPGQYVSLTVSDTGVGMSADVQAHLFEPFFTTKEQGKGTGLGLATIHGVVTGCGGSIGVYSEVGRGSSFVVYLPCATALAVPAAAETAPSSMAVRARTVLVVEDADGLRELILRMLQRQGHTVLLASNATEALQRFEEHPAIELLLTDVIMPGASGPELTVDLLKRRPSLQVIYMSGYTEDTIVRHGVVLPGINFLHKPFTARALARKIRDVVTA
jgi:CheY-like chemotaxis protein